MRGNMGDSRGRCGEPFRLEAGDCSTAGDYATFAPDATRSDQKYHIFIPLVLTLGRSTRATKAGLPQPFSADKMGRGGQPLS